MKKLYWRFVSHIHHLRSIGNQTYPFLIDFAVTTIVSLPATVISTRASNATHSISLHIYYAQGMTAWPAFFSNVDSGRHHTNTIHAMQIARTTSRILSGDWIPPSLSSLRCQSLQDSHRADTLRPCRQTPAMCWCPLRWRNEAMHCALQDNGMGRSKCCAFETFHGLHHIGHIRWYSLDKCLQISFKNLVESWLGTWISRTVLGKTPTIWASIAAPCRGKVRPHI